MIEDGVECIVDIRNDLLFGPVVMFGIGGVLVEILRDVAFALAPLDERRARDLIGRVKASALLDGHRGGPPADRDALVKALVAVSEQAAANAARLRTIEINPLRVLGAGDGVVALDAVIETH